VRIRRQLRRGTDRGGGTGRRHRGRGAVDRLRPALSRTAAQRAPGIRAVRAALLLTRDRDSRSIAGLEIAVSRDRGRTTRLDDAGLESLRRENPGARGLPLLAALARRWPGEVVLEYVAGNAIDVAVSPC
jgi:hypothetical protein